MDCKRIEAELVAFQLAALDGATRAGVETHLVGCGRCVGQFLALKRAIDAGEDVGEGPSELARARVLRSAGKRATLLAAAAVRDPAAQLQIPAVTARPATSADAIAWSPRSYPLTSRRRRASRVLVAMAALLLAALAPLAWRATHTPPASPNSPSLAAPETPFLPTEPVDTARTTPDNLRFL